MKRICIDCKGSVSQKAKRCRECFHKSTRGRTPHNKGKRTGFVVCIDCGKVKYPKHGEELRCRECASKYMSKHPPCPNPTWLIPWGKKWRLGKKFSEETKRKMSAIKQGISIDDWRGYVKTENQKIRYSVDYQIWRSSIFARDGYRCQMCGQLGGKIEADHIKPFSKYPKLRFAIDNGRTLCRKCHRKTDTWGFKTVWQKK